MNDNNNDDLIKYIQAAVQAGINEGVKQATKQIEDAIKQKRERIYDNRLHNTKLLLKHYRSIVKFTDNAVFKENDLETLTIGEVIEKLDAEDTIYSKEETIIESILRSKKRSEIIIAHVKKMVNFYLFEAKSNNDEAQQERAQMIYEYYINGDKKPSMVEMADYFIKSERQVRRDIATATREIATYIFGFDGINSVI